jgi:hypothetical protein
MNAAGRQVEDFAERCRIQNHTELVLHQFPEGNDLMRYLREAKLFPGGR